MCDLTQQGATVATSAVSASNSSIDDFEVLLKRNLITELVLVTVRVMDSNASIGKEALDSLLTEAGKSLTTSDEMKISSLGEIFNPQVLKPLKDLRQEVSDFLATRGNLVGKSGVYIIPTTSHKEVVNFLETSKSRYTKYLNNEIIGKYDALVQEQIQKINKNINDPLVRQGIINKIPTIQSILNRSYFEYRFFEGKMPSKDQMAELVSLSEAYQHQDMGYIEKITGLFKEFSRNFSGKDDDFAKIGKKASAFEKAVNTALSFEQDLDLVLTGSQYEDLKDSTFDLLHQAKDLLCVPLKSREKEQVKNKLLTKIRLATYVLSSQERLMDFKDGKLEVFEADFSLLPKQTVFKQTDLPFEDPQPQTSDLAVSVASAAEKALPDESSPFDEFLQAKQEEVSKQSTVKVEDPNESAPIVEQISLDELKGMLNLNQSQASVTAVAPLKVEEEQNIAEQATPQPSAQPNQDQAFLTGIDEAIDAVKDLLPSSKRSSLCDQDRVDLSAFF